VDSRTRDFFEALTEARGGQTNGLCGLSFLTTGLHTGRVEVTVELLDAPAPVSDEWEDVVEVSFRPAAEKVHLVQWAGEASWPLPLQAKRPPLFSVAGVSSQFPSQLAIRRCLAGSRFRSDGRVRAGQI
jgi:hypothetical protein